MSITLPSRPGPVYIIGAGGIVNTAHLPAYALAGFEVKGIFDIEHGRALDTAGRFNIPGVFESLDQMFRQAEPHCVFDVAVPGSALTGVLQQLPQGSSVLIQKPMGENIEQARQVLSICRNSKLNAGINFQLRYAPFIAELRDMLRQGMLGELIDIEVNVNVYTPWHLWEFLYGAPRVEILYHSIHYIDLVRNFWGNPLGVYAKTVKHPDMMELASVRTNIILDYGDILRASILTNHCHVYGLQHQQSYLKFEGTKGAVRVSMGVLQDYPAGVADKFEYITMESGRYGEWKTKEITGSWFPHAFIGSMAQVMLAAEGSIESPDNSVEDCFNTMACVEAAYQSSEGGGVKPVTI